MIRGALSFPEMAGVAMHPVFYEGLGAIAAHTETQRMEAGLLVSRREDGGLACWPPILPQRIDENGKKHPRHEGGTLLPIPPSQLSLVVHSHPYYYVRAHTISALPNPSAFDITELIRFNTMSRGMVGAVLNKRAQGTYSLTLYRPDPRGFVPSRFPKVENAYQRALYTPGGEKRAHRLAARAGILMARLTYTGLGTENPRMHDLENLEALYP